MCPPAQPPPCEIGFYWSDEQIISLLADYSPGCYLPDNVLEDSSPFLYPPSNLREGMWYLVHSNEEKESAYGFWKAKGEACEVYSDNAINGWRTTLEYFEGDGQLTNWLMQEYMITLKELNDKYRPQATRLLCRVFLSSDQISTSNMNPQNCKNVIESKNINPVKSINPDTKTTHQDSKLESLAKRECEVETLGTKPNSPPQDLSELECFSRGDFLELNDLEDEGSHSSSSQNSSCPSKLSEEYFGSTDFLLDLEEEVDRQEQLSSSGYRFSNVVLQPALSGSTSSTTSGTSTKEENKAGSSRVNKFRTYFCFATF